MSDPAYADIYDQYLKPLAKDLERYLADMVAELPHIDRVSARAKSPERFLAKASKIIFDDIPKYDFPLSEIQDQIGARIIVFYLSDIDKVKQTIFKYATPIELKHKEPESTEEFGYFGTHMILPIPDDIIPEEAIFQLPAFFELQIKTLFQHAWSEAHHDLGYKAARKLSSDEKRRVAFTAAQAWGADRMFDELAMGLVFSPLTGQDWGQA